jgi:SAM-dependent methyltransferase
MSSILAIDEEGYLLSGELRYNDESLGFEVLANLKKGSSGALQSSLAGEKIFIEAFSDPLVVSQVYLEEDKVQLEFPYGYVETLNLNTLCSDDWDRFIARSKNDLSIVFSRKAQNEMFQLADSFEDDSICFSGVEYAVRHQYSSQNQVSKSEFWQNAYLENRFHWDLQAAHPALYDFIPGMRLPKLRVLILGCGHGHDAHFFASKGHIVTAVDFSELAIKSARELYPDSNINWICADVFSWSKNIHAEYDLIFEHTFFCAIEPKLRQQLVQIWSQLLLKGGSFIAVFFILDQTSAPPFGATEWEIRERLKKNFQFLTWGRYKKSVPGRSGKELFITAVKK